MLQSLLLVLSLCLDTFVASVAYGTDKIKIPFYSSIIINLICSLFLGISLFLSNILKDFIPINIASRLSFFLLLSLGIYRIFEVFFIKYIRKCKGVNIMQIDGILNGYQKCSRYELGVYNILTG